MASLPGMFSVAAVEKAFSDRPFIEQRKARMLWYLGLIVLVLAVSYSLISLLLSGSIQDGILFSAVIAPVLGSLFALRRGKLFLAGNLLLAAGFLVLMVSAVSSGNTHRLKLYHIAFFGLFMLFISCLVGNSRLQILGTFVASVAVETVYLVRIVLPVSNDNFWDAIDPLLASVFVFVLAAFAGLSLRSMIEQAVRRLWEEREEIGKINAGLGGALKSAGLSLEKGDMLISSATATEETAAAIDEKVRAVAEKAEVLAGKADEMDSINNEMVNHIDVLGQVLENQNGLVGTAATAVEQMNAAIRNLSRISLTQAERTNSLANSAEKGRKDLELGRTTIERLSRSIGSITEVLSIIDDLSNRTNLLAMNAAIEAAHAGDRGKGFAVVASEIRKLAETSAENTRRISETIRMTIEEIRESQAVNAAALSLLESITSGAKETSKGMDEIRDALQEISTGTGEIDTAMSELREKTRTGRETLMKTGIAVGCGIVNRDATVEAIREVSRRVEELHERIGPLRENASGIRAIGEENRNALEELAGTMKEIGT